MSKVRMCDRCGKIVKKRNSYKYIVKDMCFKEGADSEYTFCKDCDKEFMEWYTEKMKEKRVKPL